MQDHGAAVEGPERAVCGGLADVGAGVDVLACCGGEGVAAPFGVDDVEVCGGEGGEEREEEEGLHLVGREEEI